MWAQSSAGLWKWIWRILWPSLLAKNAHPESISFQFKPQRDWLAEAKPSCLHSADASCEWSEVDHNYQTPARSLYRCVNCFTPKHILSLVHVLPINPDSALAAISELLFEGSLGNPQWLDRDSLKPWEWCNNWKQGGYVSLWPRGKQMFAQSDRWPWVTALL